MTLHRLPPRQPDAVGTYVQGALALSIQPRLDPPETSPDADVLAFGRSRATKVERWAMRFVQAAIEIVGGDRPASQLTRWCSTRVAKELRHRADALGLAGDFVPGRGRVMRLVPRVASARACLVGDDVAEVSLRAQYGERHRAVAARFEWTKDRWLCTALTWG